MDAGPFRDDLRGIEAARSHVLRADCHLRVDAGGSLMMGKAS